NKLLGEKISIISPKPQTTRQQIKGIFTDESRQIVFLDTPGFVKARYELHEKMLEYIKNSLTDSDVIIFITDAHKFPTDYDKEMCEWLKRFNVPKIALLNKIDLVEQDKVLKKVEELEQYDFNAVVPLSILESADLDYVIEMISSYLPYNPPYYHPDEVSDLPMRFFVQEIIRERIFLNFKDEIPYASTVVVEEYKDYPNKVHICANIWIESKSQKPILLGKGGNMIKKIRLESEKEIHKIIKKRVKLELWVKIKPNWRKKKNALKEFGY
ncbi:MAG: GTPase Era, partial [Candidatus Cloacimonetes bacterium]|nr:GTPase Era [Candidatus Cloacimonadota bacterium]